MAYTVTATQSGSNEYKGGGLSVAVVTGWTGIGATASSIAATLPELASGTVSTGSYIYGAVWNFVTNVAFSSLSNAIFTAGSGASAGFLNYADATNGVTYGTFRSASATSVTTSVTYGAGAPSEATGNITICLCEIRGSGIAQDASTPAGVTWTSGYTATTASFTPPAGSLLVAMVVADPSTFAATTVAVTNTGGTLTWTKSAYDAYSITSVWTAVVPGAGPSITTTSLPARRPGAGVLLHRGGHGRDHPVHLVGL